MQVGLTASAYVKRGEHRKRVLLALDRPRTPTELAKAIGIRWGYVNRILKEFKKLDLAGCVNPGEITGRLYRLTPKGARLRTAFCRELIGFKPYKEPSGFDWNVYAAIARGKQRRAFLRAMDTNWRTREEIRKQALQFDDRIWRPNAYDVLRFLLRTKLIRVTTEATPSGSMRRLYKLSKKGVKIKEWLVSHSDASTATQQNI